MAKYDHQKIEQKWQKYWLENKTFAAQDFADKPKYYALDMFPYPSGVGLHVGHPEGYTATDIISRKRRHQGYSVLHPLGWDAFGLPAENYAIKTGTHPNTSTQANIQNFRRQIQSLGFSYDWDREIDTTDPKYYRWSQWIFLQLYKKGLAYEKEMTMNWCPQCKIVAANEEVEQGTHERCGATVERRNLRQWMFRITDYAQRLLDDLDTLSEWPEAIRTQQRNWIGRSEGAEVDFTIKGEKVRVFTTRPDTLFGATYFVLSPEHPLVNQITTAEQKSDIEKYQKKCAALSELERTELNQEKTGVFTGAFAINPVNGKEIPVWIADYVMMSYGTGAIMAVPAHDERDNEFAKKYNLPIIEVVEDKGYYSIELDSWTEEDVLKVEKIFEERFKIGAIKKSYEVTGKTLVFLVVSEMAKEKLVDFIENVLKKDVRINKIDAGENKGCFSGHGVMKNSEFLSYFCSQEAKNEMFKWLEDKKLGEKKINFKLRDWIFTRQRYWGEPIPLVFDEAGKCYTLDDSQLPLILPETDDFHPTEDGQPPLARCTDWVNVEGYITDDGNVIVSDSVPAGKTLQKFRRETSTMPNWAGSSWYWLRYMDANNEQEFCSKEREAYWGPVDLYVGGTEHAVLHLLYARFWHKVLFDLGLVNTTEPFKKLVNQGLILGEDGEKMSKSRGNVVNPDEIVESMGADTLRMYEMFMGPFEQSKPWSTKSTGGLRKFLDKIYRIYTETEMTDECSLPVFQKIIAETIKKVEEDIEDFKFNTAISQLMIFFNEAQKYDILSRGAMKKILVLIEPFAPHLAEEIWSEVFGEKESMANAPWPTYEQSSLEVSEVTYAVQVNGKLRGDFTISKTAGKDEAIAVAQDIENVRKYLDGGNVVKEIFVPGKIVGFVVK